MTRALPRLIIPTHRRLPTKVPDQSSRVSGLILGFVGVLVCWNLFPLDRIRYLPYPDIRGETSIQRKQTTCSEEDRPPAEQSLTGASQRTERFSSRQNSGVEVLLRRRNLPPVEFGKNPQDEPKRGGECDIPNLLPAHKERRRIELPDILVTLVTSRTASSHTNDQQTEPPLITTSTDDSCLTEESTLVATGLRHPRASSTLKRKAGEEPSPSSRPTI